jgi:hypothetical protein
MMAIVEEVEQHLKESTKEDNSELDSRMFYKDKPIFRHKFNILPT